jgi:hypothetical protein
LALPIQREKGQAPRKKAAIASMTTVAVSIIMPS